MRYLKQPKALLLLRLSVALIFFLHAFVRLLNGTIAQFGEFLNLKGFVFGITIVWIITVFELLGAIFLAVGKLVKLMCTGFIVLLLVGIILIHFSQGWFVGEHGTGGMEYSFILIMVLTTVMSGEKQNTH